MADWQIEEGIGEHRAARIVRGRIAEARIEWPGGLAPGHVIEPTLSAKTAGSSRGTVRADGGEEALVDRLPREASEGAPLRVEVLRAAIGERGRSKLAHVRPTNRPLARHTLAERLRSEGRDVKLVRRFLEGDWNELAAEAIEGTTEFAGGSLIFAPTPGMTVIDIDGTLPARDLAMAAIAPLADAIRRLDLGGSIGIDFPTLEAKADRRAVDAALAEALADWPHERTAMNGFGFVQLVARLERQSVLHRAHFQRAAFVARQLLRRAELVEEPGALLLTCHPAVAGAIAPAWRDELTRRTGREVRIAEIPTLAPEAAFAQAVAR